METLQVGRAKLTWLSGGVNFLDGGAMFGVVPKPLWGKKYPYNEKNQIELRTDPILIELDGKHFLIDSGLGNGKLTEKQIRNFGALEQSFIDESLRELGLTTDDIDAVLMTHLHFDHASGLTNWEDEKLVPTFRNATVYTSQVEWDEMRKPNIRSINTYWEDNWKPVQEKVQTFENEIKIADGLKMIHTGGHSDGHAIVLFEDGVDSFLHMADIMPTHAHQNVLWVLAYDDYPVTSVFQKEMWMEKGYGKESWYTFYHDAYYRAIKYNGKGEVIDKLSREQYDYDK
ncbi:MBL fold metallo-hydrolase [Aquibacillus sp. 3ASR75-11]|uniref:MBL fold metallo-hydrolase n=1 Tax=Terrihalobacillus insolitus TaxID=2950438 RepID=A0A9X3WXN9_9BACI|nr:MBL fold metallo-hydrolase [Terrihalobacillus insolitus]MDC3415084.1 MBL fold metallo-hydrolase [Terrihalobacillus insolitus]MDC3426081.1 MBL fold metallo-hydrolase [Terrihalobacillus insolitus]